MVKQVIGVLKVQGMPEKKGGGQKKILFGIKKRLGGIGTSKFLEAFLKSIPKAVEQQDKHAGGGKDIGGDESYLQNFWTKKWMGALKNGQ